MCGIHGAVALAALLTLAMPVACQAAPSVPAPDAKYDPKRDAAQDIQAALAEARRTNRRVILDVGGEWCGWCHTLDRYFVDHQELRSDERTLREVGAGARVRVHLKSAIWESAISIGNLKSGNLQSIGES